MADINSIIRAIDDFLEKKSQEITTPVEINPHLEKLGLLNDSTSRPGLSNKKTFKSWENPTCISNWSELANSSFRK